MASDNKTTIDMGLVVKEKVAVYGAFDVNAKVIQSIKRVMVDTPNWDSLPDDMKQSLEMMACKIGRILTGDIRHIDSWHDISGYSKLITDKLETVGGQRAATSSDEAPAVQP